MGLTSLWPSAIEIASMESEPAKRPTKNILKRGLKSTQCTLTMLLPSLIGWMPKSDTVSAKPRTLTMCPHSATSCGTSPQDKDFQIVLRQTITGKAPASTQEKASVTVSSPINSKSPALIPKRTGLPIQWLTRLDMRTMCFSEDHCVTRLSSQSTTQRLPALPLKSIPSILC